MASPPSPSVCSVNQGPGLNIATSIVVAFSALFVVARFVIRSRIVKVIGWDDWTILFAILGTVIGAALDYVEVHYGFGRHQSCLTDYQMKEFQKFVWGEWIQTFASLMWTKVSICLFLLRIPVKKIFIRPLQGAVIFLMLSNLILTLCWIFQCLPIDAAWNTGKPGKCFSRHQKLSIILVQAIISVIADVCFAFCPIIILWKVQIKPKTKIGLCFLMGFGVITGACCIVRTAINYQSIPQDMTYGGIDNWYWRLLEVQFGIVAACIPTLPPGYKWVREHFSHGGSSRGRLPLAERADFRPSNSVKMASIPQAFRTDNAFLNPLSDGGAGRIQRTTEVDMEWDRDGENIREHV